MPYDTPIRAGPVVRATTEVPTLSALSDAWAVIARQPFRLMLDGASGMVWLWTIPEAELSLFRGGRMLGAISTVQGQDAAGCRVLYARRGSNRKWWSDRESC